MKKLSSLVDRLQELASSVPTEHQSQLLKQVKALRATSRKQQEQFMDFLQLSEEYANEYLLDIDAYIQQQSSFLAKLERRLEVAKKLRGEAAELQMLYESGTVATMKNLRATGKPTYSRLQRQNTDKLFSALPRPLPEDQALFREVDFVLTDIKQCYSELYKFWTEEISHAMEAFENRRVDRTDFERWRNFHANLKQTIESWKVQYEVLFPCAQYQPTLFRLSYPVVMLKVYSATMHVCLGFAGFTSSLGSFRLTPRRKPTSGQ